MTVRPFALAVYEITFREWRACADAGDCRRNPRPDDEGWGRVSRPAVHVSWDDITGEGGFLDWLNAKVGGALYRRPSEAECEYAARAGTTGPYWMGGAIATDQAVFYGGGLVLRASGAGGDPTF